MPFSQHINWRPRRAEGVGLFTSELRMASSISSFGCFLSSHLQTVQSSAGMRVGPTGQSTLG